MHIQKSLVLGSVATLLQIAPLAAAEEIYAAAWPVAGKDLSFPTAPQPFGFAKASSMFKPAAAGPFPALVILPTCGGHGRPHSFDWAKAALERGYVVLVVDPLTPRGVVGAGENCSAPSKVTSSRYRKDAFDAAEHLRKQPFVDPDRIGLLGLSMGGMAALGAAGEDHARSDGRPPFQAIVSIYPICFLANLQLPNRKDPVNVRFVPDKVVVPLLVQVGELDTEAPPKDCVARLQERKDKGAPVDFVVHKGATHGWDQASLGKQAYRKRGQQGQEIVYRHNPEATAESMNRAFEFLDRYVGKGWY